MIEEQGPLGISDDREVVELWSSLRREIRRRGVDPETADDLAQESWLRTLRAPPERDGRGLGGWLHVVGARLVSEFRRSSQNRLARERRVARREETLDPEDGESRVQRLVGELPSPYREVVYLRFYEDRSLTEIARQLGRPTVTVRSQLARGLERLRQRLSEEDRRPWQRLLALVGLRPGRWSWPRVLASTGVAFLAVVVGAWWLGAGERGAADRPREARAAAAGPLLDGVQGARQPALGPAALAGTSTPEVGPEPAGAGPARALAGTVRTADGWPVAGATLYGGARRGAGRVLGASDAAGRYELPSVPVEGFVWVAADGFADSRRLYVHSLALGKEHDFELPADHGELPVRVLEPDGRPASDVSLSFLPVGASDTSVVAASGALEIATVGDNARRTDAEGRASFRRPHEAQLLFLAFRADALVLREVVQLEPEAHTLELHLPRAARVGGQLRSGGGVAVGVKMVARQRDLDLFLTTVTDTRGRFEFEGLLPGEFGLQAYLPEHGRAVSFVGELGEGEERELVLEAEERMALTGTVLDDAGPLAGAQVALYREGRHALGADDRCVTGPDGAFLFCVSPEIDYWLEWTRPGDDRPSGFLRHARGGDVLELRPLRELEATAALTLRFRAERPELLPTLVKLRSVHPRLTFDAVVDADGRVQVELPRTTFELAAWVPGVGFWRRAEPFTPDLGELDVLVPRPSGVELRLELPRGVQVPGRVGVRVGGLNPFGFDGPGAIFTEFALAADPERRLFAGELFPSKASYFAEVPGFTAEIGVLELLPGERTELVLRPRPANRVAVTLELPRALATGEGAELVARTPEGPVPIPFAGTNRTLARIELVVELPRGCEELVFTTTGGLAGAVPVDADPPRRLSLPVR